ncbi:MAG: hypothetical protein JOY92_07135 [Verrucomicrobia bacterium]|nr:hypothetical protein [Verrucomicrobiota bacterium]
MAIDQNIQNSDPNTCLYMEDTSGDGGNHTDPTFWLSPDCQMANGPGTDPSFANEGAKNTTSVIIYKKPDCALAGDSSAVVFDLYVCTPSLNIVTPTFDPTSSVQLASSSLAVVTTPGGTPNANDVTWTPSSNSGDPNGPGHKCLIARCYPFGATPDQEFLSKYIPEDPHYVQHNLTIGVASQHSPGPHGIKIRTGNGARENETVTIRAVSDFKPSDTVLQAILPSLRAVPGFARIATRPVRHFGLNLDVFKNERNCFEEPFEYLAHLVCDVITGLFGKLEHPNIETKVTIRPRFFADFTFSVDASGSNVGDAHIFHLTQADHQGQFQGGLTVAVVTT